MTVVGVMEMIAHEEIDVVAVWDRLVTATLAVHVLGAVPATAMLWRAIPRIRRADLEHVLVDVVAVWVMQVAVVEVVSVIPVRDRQMTAARTVLVGVVGMDRVLTHAPEYPLARRDLQADGSEKRSQTTGRDGERPARRAFLDRLRSGRTASASRDASARSRPPAPGPGMRAARGRCA
jgi:hypothetical protein